MFVISEEKNNILIFLMKTKNLFYIKKSLILKNKRHFLRMSQSHHMLQLSIMTSPGLGIRLIKHNNNNNNSYINYLLFAQTFKIKMTIA